MAITTTTLTKAAGLAAVAAGLTFIGVQVGHPHLDAESITTTEVAVRTAFKVLMAALAVVGITGMYLRQVTRTGVLGLVGYVVLSAGYLLIMSTTIVAGFALPAIADTDPGYVNDVIEASTGGSATGDIGLLQPILQLQGVFYLAGGLLFGVALFRARVLARWAAALLAVGGLASVALSQMPDAFYRMLAVPNAVAMIGLGYSLWSITRAAQATDETSEGQTSEGPVVPTPAASAGA
ncbi:hypothetical protein [Nocardioides sp.]|uniref:hypothetical protein n=1 Tax=Nocardioides sp. TaxID=35761 RepID=UPI002ED4ED48